MAVEPIQTPSSAEALGASGTRSSPVVAALSVYVERLVADARVAVIGDSELGMHAALLELGARTVHLYDPDPDRVARTTDDVPRGVSVRMLRADFDVRDGAFDLVVIPDVGLLPDPAGLSVRLRRVVDARGTVVAMGRARTEATSHDETFPELVSTTLEYAELYDLFALQFENVTMTGVLPFAGVVFAELGGADDLAVSVDTRLVEPGPPSVFVVIAGREDTTLDPYAIVQTQRGREEPRAVAAPAMASARDADSRVHEVEAAFAAMQLKAELLAAQLDEHRERLVHAEALTAEHTSHVSQLALERDLGLTRAAELETILRAAQDALAVIEARFAEAEATSVEKDQRLASLGAELDARAAAEAARTLQAVPPEAIAEMLARAERAEASLALHVADLASVAEAHAAETAALEAQLRERARVIAETEKELVRREQLVRELVASLEESREEGGASRFEAAPSAGISPEEMVRLRKKLDELALEVARRDGELVARGWRITELETENARLARGRDERAAAPSVVSAPAAQAGPSGKGGEETPARAELERELARARDELDALRQALTQEHTARIAAEQRVGSPSGN